MHTSKNQGTIMLIHFLTTAWRNISRQRAFATINVIGLSVGITCCLVLVIYSRYETSFDRFHPFGANTFRIVEDFKSSEATVHWNTTAYPLAEALRNDFNQIPVVTQASGPELRSFSVTNDKGAVDRFEDQVLFADPFYVKVFYLSWLAGDSRTALSQPNSIVLTERIAHRCFGQRSDYAGILGKTVVLNKDPMIVTGVIKDAPGNTSLQYSMLVPYEFYRTNNPYPTSNWSGNYQGTTFVVLDENTNTSDLEKQIAVWQKKYLKPEDDARITYKFQPLYEMHNDATYGNSPGSYTMPWRNIQAAYAVALFILIIAAVNFVNLTTAQAATRAKEVGVRKMMGSTRLVVVRQFVLENTMLILCTLIVSLALTTFILDALNSSLTIINLTLKFQWTDLLIAAAIGISVIALAAIYPAIVIAKFNPVQILKGKSAMSYSRGGSLRRSLIIVQFAIVQVFIIATIVVWKQMQYVQTKDLGFETEAIVNFHVPNTSNAQVLAQRLSQQPGVERVTFGSGAPLAEYDASYGTSFRLPRQPETDGQGAEMKGIDTTFLSFFDLKLLAGKNITMTKHPFDEFVINESAARSMGWTPEDAIGRRLVINEGEATVVGVVQDFHNNTLREEITPCILINWAAFQNEGFVKLNTTAIQTSGVLAGIEKVWHELYPDAVYKYAFLTDAMQRKYTMENIILNGFSLFSILSVLIGAMGLLGMISFMTARKTKEVGIRKVLGASVEQIVVLFSKEFVVLVGVAFLIASPLVYTGMSRWLQDFAYAIDLSWWMFAVGGFSALIIAIVTVLFQSARAAVANPVDSLRSE
ncbi:ABC transporter permease [Chryseolinea sp. T2]|uniref:ABC transporter permease n=1 Tax=Chryseolinea sp. T2 TaxID=3129255 RepID=UPI003077787E